MKCGARVALGVAGGYFLGRTKKMKLGLMLGGMAAGQKAGGPSALLAQGSKLLSASPELSRLSGEVRGRLLEAGKAAALSVAARQVEAVTDRLGQRVESLGDIGKGGRKSKKAAAEPVADDEYDEPSAEVDDEVGEDEDDAQDLPDERAEESDEGTDEVDEEVDGKRLHRRGGPGGPRAPRGAGPRAPPRPRPSGPPRRRPEGRGAGRASPHPVTRAADPPARVGAVAMADTSDAAEKTGSLTNAPTDALKEAGQQLLGLLVQRAAQAATDRVGGLSDRLSGVAENGGTGLTSALREARTRTRTRTAKTLTVGPAASRGSVKAFSSIKEKITGALGGGGDGGGGGSGKKLKVTLISEDIDIGLPLRTTYNLWTQFGDFPGFMKKVETVDQESDEKTNWKAQVFWSHRTWEATIVEQVPDSHIVWKSKGAKGHVDGTVTLHRDRGAT